VKNAKVSCLTWTAVFLALAGASGWFVYRRLPAFSTAFFGGFAGGLILLIAFAWMREIPRRIVEWWSIVRTRFGSEPRDGKRVAIIGTLRGNGELHAPFTRERCVLYSYEIIIRDIVDGESSERKAYEGFAMVPLSIEHGSGRTRIHARPELPKLPSTEPKSRTAEATAKRFVEDTTFTPAPAKSAEDAPYTDGHQRYDYSTAPIETNIGACRLVEKVVRPETNVCALGTYQADRQALVAPVTLRTGTSFGIDAAWRVVNAVIAGTIFAAIAVIALAVFCANFPIEASEQSHPQWTLAWWEIDFERFVEKSIRTPMIRYGMLDAPGDYLQELCEGCAKGHLEIDGRTIELKHAAYVGERTVHLSTKPGDRDGVTLDGREHVVLTIDGKSADVPPSWLQPKDIETSLGSNGEYAGRVTVIAPDGWIRCRVSFNTRVDADAWLPSYTPRDSPRK
jgi:hypothetical protein